MSKFKIEVRPEPYRTRDGKKVFVVGTNGYHYCQFECSDGETRFEDGRYDDSKRGFDIIGDWEKPPAPVASPDRMEVWRGFAEASLAGYLFQMSDDIRRQSILQCAKEDGVTTAVFISQISAEAADAMLAEYERRKGGGA